MISSGQFSFCSQKIVRNVHGRTQGTQSWIIGDGFPRYLCLCVCVVCGVHVCVRVCVLCVSVVCVCVLAFL